MEEKNARIVETLHNDTSFLSEQSCLNENSVTFVSRKKDFSTINFIVFHMNISRGCNN